MKNVLNGWHIMRGIRLILGLAVLIHGIVSKDFLAIILGGLFAGMAVANIGCCGANGCAVTPRDKTQKTNDITYEEVDYNK